MREFFLGACEVAWSLQARLAGLQGFYDRAFKLQNWLIKPIATAINCPK